MPCHHYFLKVVVGRDEPAYCLNTVMSRDEAPGRDEVAESPPEKMKYSAPLEIAQSKNPSN